MSSDNCRIAPCGKPLHGEGRSVESRGNNVFLLGRHSSTMPICQAQPALLELRPQGSLSTAQCQGPWKAVGAEPSELLSPSLLLSFSSICSDSSSCLAPAPPCPLLVPRNPIPPQQLSPFSSLPEQITGTESSDLLFLSH